MLPGPQPSPGREPQSPDGRPPDIGLRRGNRSRDDSGPSTTCRKWSSEVSQADPPADDGWSFCNHRPVSTSSPVRLVLFDVDGTLVDHDGATAAGAQQWLMAMGWADAGTIAGLVSEWDEIAERHFPAYRARLTTFQGQRRLRLREFLPRVGIDASTWSDERLDDLFNTYLVAYEAA